ncbi:hypothetical protein B4129_3572 [Bacillus safensis]|nr:hypothetical protein B4129_3572 [Bacillus safensis]
MFRFPITQMQKDLKNSQTFASYVMGKGLANIVHAGMAEKQRMFL